MNFKLDASSNFSQEFLKRGILEFYDAMEFIKNLPYGRNSNRTDFQLVLSEKKGTCSSKHALLKELADENSFSDIKLILGIFEMHGENYPKIQKTLAKNKLEFIPEAHTYLKIKDQIFDCTSPSSSEKTFQPFLLSEIEIEAIDVVEKKIQIHQSYLKNWCAENSLDFDKVWEIREECIQDLSF